MAEVLILASVKRTKPASAIHSSILDCGLCLVTTQQDEILEVTDRLVPCLALLRSYLRGNQTGP